MGQGADACGHRSVKMELVLRQRLAADRARQRHTWAIPGRATGESGGQEGTTGRWAESMWG